MAADTGVNVEGFKVEVEKEKCFNGDLSSVSVGVCDGDGKDDYVFVNGSDVVSDDHDRNVGLDSHETVRECEVGGSEVNGDRELGAVDGESDELSNKGREVENGASVGLESEGKMEIGEIMSGSDPVVKDEDGTSSGRSFDGGGDAYVKVRDVDVVEENCIKPLTNGFKNGDSGDQNGDECSSFVDGTGIVHLNGDGSAALSGDKQMRSEMPCGQSEEQENLSESWVHEDQGNVLETTTCEAGKFDVVDDDVQSKPEEVVVKDMEQMDSNIEVDVGHQPLVGESQETQASNNDEGHDLQECSEPQGSDVGGNSVVDDAIIADQPSDCQEPKREPVDGVHEETHTVDAEAEVKEQVELDPPVVVENQEHRSVDSEAITNEKTQNVGSGEIEGQTATSLNEESEEVQELRSDVFQSKGADNENSVASTSPGIERLVSEGSGHADLSNIELPAEVDQSNETSANDIQSDVTLDCDIKRVDVNGTPEACSQLVGNQESDIEEDAIVDQVAEKSGSEVDQSCGILVRDMQSDISDKPGVDVNETSELSTQEVGNRDSSIEEDAIAVQVAEDFGSAVGTAVDDMAGKTSDLGRLEAVENKVSDDVPDSQTAPANVSHSQSVFDDVTHSQTVLHVIDSKTVSDDVIDNQSMSDDVVVGQTVSDFIDNQTDLHDVVGSQTITNDVISSQMVSGDVIDSRTVCVSGDTTNTADCSTADDGDLSRPIDTASDLPDSSDFDSLEEKGVVDTSSCVASDSVYCSAGYASSENIVELAKGALSSHVPDPNLQTAAESEIDVVNKSNCSMSNTSKPKISFGSFECEAPFSHNDPNVQPEVVNRSVEVPSIKSNVKPEKSVNGVHSTEFDNDKASEDLGVESITKEKMSASPVNVIGGDVAHEQNLNPEVVKRPYYYLVRIPRYDDENLREKIRLHDVEVREKTQIRDSVRAEYLKTKDIIADLKSGLQSSRLEERAARDLVLAKKREIDSALSLINLAKNAITVEDVESRILNIEHKIQHETLHLNEEKQLVREIKQMKNLKGQLNSSTLSQEKLQQALDQRGQVEEQLKVLRKELDALKDKLSKAEQNFQAARKKFDEKSSLLNDLYNKFKSADAVRQKAYEDLLILKKQLSEKNKHFWNYRDDAKAAYDLRVAGDNDGLEQHCDNQVEKIMELWNKDDEFRKEYIRCNKRSILRRFRTLDGRSLGPNEESPSLGNFSDARETSTAKVKVDSVATVSTLEKDIPRESQVADDASLKKVVEPKIKAVLDKKLTVAKATSKNSSAEASGRTEIEEEKEEVKPTKEEVELARKEEHQRREAEAERSREQRRLEEIAKAKDASERKKRMAEKAQARAEFRARKEAEEKEKEREKRAKKKEKKRGVTSETAKSEPAALPVSSSDTTQEPEVTEKSVTTAKKPIKPSTYTKQIKTTKSIPPPVRRGKKKIKQWIYVLIPVMIVLALFFLGDSNFFRNWSYNFGSSTY